MKLINESIAHTFSRSGTDKLSSIGIGRVDLIKKWLEEYDKNYQDNIYKITDDYIINVSDTINLTGQKIGEFPSYIQFGFIGNNFSCSDCELTSLRGCPNHVAGNFRCTNNLLTSLQFCPIEIGQTLAVSFNKLTSLKYSPKKIHGDFLCSGNELSSLADGPTYVGDDYYCRLNKITSLDDFYCIVDGDLIIKNNPISLNDIEMFKKSDHNNVRLAIVYE